MSPLSPALTLVLVTSVLTTVVVSLPIALIVAWYVPHHHDAQEHVAQALESEGPATGMAFQWPSFLELAEQAAGAPRPRHQEAADSGRSKDGKSKEPSKLGQVAKRLSLSDAQQEEIRRIMAASTAAMEQLPQDAPAEERARLLEDARGRFLNVLTDRQRREWEALSEDLGESP